MQNSQQQNWTIETWFQNSQKYKFKIDLRGNYHRLDTTNVYYLMKNYSLNENEISFEFTRTDKNEQNKIKIRKPAEIKFGYSSFDNHNFYSLEIEYYSELEYLEYSLNDNKIIARGLYYDTTLWLSFNIRGSRNKKKLVKGKKSIIL